VQIKLNALDTRLARIERVVDNESLLQLSNDLEAARAAIRSLHNDVDELSHNLDAARKQERDFYADLDRRLRAVEARRTAGGAAPDAGAGDGVTNSGANAGSSTGAAPAGAAPGDGSAGARGATTGEASAMAARAAAAGEDSAASDAGATGGVGAAASGAGAAGGVGAAASGPGAAGAADESTKLPGGDRANYQAAFTLLKDNQYDKAIAAFKQFLVSFPDSALAGNAQYWLGEAYYVNRDLPDALSAFQGVADNYPSSSKLPDAMLKIGYCRDELKQYDQAKSVLNDVVTRFGDTPAGSLAKLRLQQIGTEKH
jgi:tol-pal system protein YbgF